MSVAERDVLSPEVPSVSGCTVVELFLDFYLENSKRDEAGARVWLQAGRNDCAKFLKNTSRKNKEACSWCGVRPCVIVFFRLMFWWGRSGSDRKNVIEP